jgi:hypothetical protein
MRTRCPIFVDGHGQAGAASSAFAGPTASAYAQKINLKATGIKGVAITRTAADNASTLIDLAADAPGQFLFLTQFCVDDGAETVTLPNSVGDIAFGAGARQCTTYDPPLVIQKNQLVRCIGTGGSGRCIITGILSAK